MTILAVIIGNIITIVLFFIVISLASIGKYGGGINDNK